MYCGHIAIKPAGSGGFDEPRAGTLLVSSVWEGILYKKWMVTSAMIHIFVR